MPQFGDIDYFAGNQNVHLCIGTAPYRSAVANYRNTFEYNYVLNLIMKKIIKPGEKHIIYLVDGSYRDNTHLLFSDYIQNMTAKFNSAFETAHQLNSHMISVNSNITISYELYNISTNNINIISPDNFDYVTRCIVNNDTLYGWGRFFSSLSEFLLKPTNKLYVHNEAYMFKLIGQPDNYFFEFFCELGYILDYFIDRKDQILLYYCDSLKVNGLSLSDAKKCIYIPYSEYKMRHLDRVKNGTL